MTRINCLPPKVLSDAHLGAEYRELPRVFFQAHAAFLRGERYDDPRNPDRYVLGKGHVRFFYPRLGYLARRLEDLVFECQTRGRKTAFHGVPDVFMLMPQSWRGNWIPSAEDLRLNLKRIVDRGGLRAGYDLKEFI